MMISAGPFPDLSKAMVVPSLEDTVLTYVLLLLLREQFARNEEFHQHGTEDIGGNIMSLAFQRVI